MCKVVGNYISRVFPFMGVRFIAVNDNFDSSRPQDIDSLDTSFKTLIYDLYSRELSGKVKAAKKMREVHEHEAPRSHGAGDPGGLIASPVTKRQGQGKRLTPPLTPCAMTAMG